MTLILGIGNSLYGDDGLGIQLARQLAERDLPAGVRVEESSSPGYELAALLGGCRRAILVDAARMGQPPGTWRRFRPEQVKRIAAGNVLSLHQVHLVTGLALAQALGLLPQEVVIYGIEPASIAAGLELSPEVQAALPQVIDQILSEVQCAAAPEG
jgi:hydrogenase maturation protease